MCLCNASLIDLQVASTWLRLLHWLLPLATSQPGAHWLAGTPTCPEGNWLTWLELFPTCSEWVTVAHFSSCSFPSKNSAAGGGTPSPWTDTWTQLIDFILNPSNCDIWPTSPGELSGNHSPGRDRTCFFRFISCIQSSDKLWGWKKLFSYLKTTNLCFS